MNKLLNAFDDNTYDSLTNNNMPDFDKWFDGAFGAYAPQVDLQYFAQDASNEVQKALDQCFDDDAEFIDEDFKEEDLLKLLDQLKGTGNPAEIRFKFKWTKRSDDSIEVVPRGYEKSLILKENRNKDKTAEAIHTFLSSLKSYKQTLEYTMTINGKEETHGLPFPVEWFSEFLWDELMNEIAAGKWQPRVASYIFKQVSDTIKEASKTLENQDKEAKEAMEALDKCFIEPDEDDLFDKVVKSITKEDLENYLHPKPIYLNEYMFIVKRLKKINEPGKITFRVNIYDELYTVELDAEAAEILYKYPEFLRLTTDDIDAEQAILKTVEKCFGHLNDTEDPAKLIQFTLKIGDYLETFIACLPEELRSKPCTKEEIEEYDYQFSHYVNTVVTEAIKAYEKSHKKAGKHMLH